MQRSMNAAVRFVAGLKKNEHITPTYIHLNLMPYSVRRDYMCVGLLCSIFKSGEPQYIFERMVFHSSDAAGFNRASTLDLVIPWTRTEFYSDSSRVYAARLWNRLPIVIRVQFDRPCFKRKLAEFLRQDHFRYS
ncbi:uncharacterized protein LOC106640337 [Copidosoma floridanum]|uniref:uncharacterized protein LOC106640337 n=1 Tax=Copidosoma floridanum TaxID=29053 RepID=UPI0006C9A74E|nr:uncharacterized protein LOC106640337 [Copidosoma floridanum]